MHDQPWDLDVSPHSDDNGSHLLRFVECSDWKVKEVPDKGQGQSKPFYSLELEN